MSSPVAFVTMANHKYYYMLDINVGFIRAVYPDAPVTIYDLGDADFRPAFSTRLPGVTVVDWGRQVVASADPGELFDLEFKLDLARRFNGRFKRTIFQRIRKQILKRAPRSRAAGRLIGAALRFENMMCQKPPCLLDASARHPDGKLVYLDADALLVRPPAALFGRDDYDLALGLEEKITWDYNHLGVINAGVIYLGADRARREAFLRAWQAAIATTKEVLREQSAMVRMLEAASPGLFRDDALTEVPLGGTTLRVLMVRKALYNNTKPHWHEDGIPYVVHLGGTGQNEALFRERVEDIRRRTREAAGPVPT